MAENEYDDGGNEEQRELRDAILALTKTVEESTKKQQKSSNDLSAKLTKTAKVTATSTSIIKSTLVGVGVTAAAGSSVKKYGLVKGLSRTGADIANGRLLARGFANRTVMSAMMRSMMAHPALAAAGVLLTGGLAASMLRGKKGGAGTLDAKESKSAANTMSDLLRESIKSGRNLTTLVAIGRMNQDPFRMGARQQAFTAALYGGVPTTREAGNLAMLQQSQMNLDMSRQGLASHRASASAPGKTFGNEISSLTNVMELYARRKASDVLSTPGGSVAGGGIAAAAGPLAAYSFFKSQAMKGIYGDPNDPNSRAARNIREGKAASLASLERGEALTRLSAMGPRARKGPASSVRAGTVAEYQFQVQQQMRAENTEARIDWQNEVLQALLKLVQNGEAQVEDLRTQQIKFGRPVMGID